jgi:hypothetical protein
MSKRGFLIVFIGLLVCSGRGRLCALDFSVSPGGFVLIPTGAGNVNASGRERYEVGGGGGLGLDIDLSSIWPNPLGLGYTVGLEGGLGFTSYKAPAEGTLQIYSLGGGLGLYYFPLSRLFTRLDGAAGAFWGQGETSRTPAGLWYRLGGEAGFRFTPSFTLAANAGWRQFQNPASGSGVFLSGLYAGLTARITFELGEKSGGDGAAVTLAQSGEVYPALLSLYQANPVGTITIRNNENAEIRNVRVSFRAGRYTASEFECATVNFLAKGRSVEVPLYADFSSDILQFTDSGRILGEIVIRYSFLGKEKETTAAASVAVLERGAFAPAAQRTENSEQITEFIDWGALAAFVSPASPEVLEFAKNVTGLARNERRTGLNGNMQFAVWLFEGLRAFGPSVRQITDNSEQRIETPNDSARERVDLTSSTAGAPENVNAGDKASGRIGGSLTVQFPALTLAYQAGTVRDWGILYAAALEASGIGAAFIPMGDGFIAVVNLGIGEGAAATLFNGLDRLLVIHDEVWLPVSMGKLNDGFAAAWDEGAAELDAVFEAGETVDFIMLADAWANYPPAPFPALGVRIAQADTAALRAGAGAALNAYIASDIAPLITAVNAQIRQSPSGVLYNRLGVLQIRAGNTAAARAAFQRGADMGSEAAKRNLENIKQ